ncbi:MAG TPA: hypothetical protein VFJ51_10250 [Nitrososphaeraceae archaeon]|nr:hypothetical protein [Nitrososphaeraceae archaeon]
MEPIHKQILGVCISRRRNMIIAEAFLSSLVRIYGKLHSSYEKSIVVERAIEYLKDRTEAFDDYFPCKRNGLCNLQH